MVVNFFVRVFCAHVCVCEKEFVGKGGGRKTKDMVICINRGQTERCRS